MSRILLVLIVLLICSPGSLAQCPYACAQVKDISKVQRRFCWSSGGDIRGILGEAISKPGRIFQEMSFEIY
jgi:hypothetical protein